jgi:hypothetical protein
VADAFISDNVFTFSETRSQEQLYIKNDFKNTKGLKPTDKKMKTILKKNYEDIY